MFEGHAFIVEAAVSLGGRDVKPGINVFRFANRIPLLFEGGSDVITKTALKRITWPSYKISQNSDKVGLGEWGLLYMAWPACPNTLETYKPQLIPSALPRTVEGASMVYKCHI